MQFDAALVRNFRMFSWKNYVGEMGKPLVWRRAVPPLLWGWFCRLAPLLGAWRDCVRRHVQQGSEILPPQMQPGFKGLTAFIVSAADPGRTLGARALFQKIMEKYGTVIAKAPAIVLFCRDSPLLRPTAVSIPAAVEPQAVVFALGIVARTAAVLTGAFMCFCHKVSSLLLLCVPEKFCFRWGLLPLLPSSPEYSPNGLFGHPPKRI